MKKLLPIISLVFVLVSCFSPWTGDPTALTVNLGGGGRTLIEAWPAVGGLAPEALPLLDITITVTGAERTQTRTLSRGATSATFMVQPGTYTVNVEASLHGLPFGAATSTAGVTGGATNSLSIQMQRSDTTFFVANNASSWSDAVNKIPTTGSGDCAIIVTNDIPNVSSAPSGGTFSGFTGTLTIVGNYSLTLNGSSLGSLLEINNNQTVIVQDIDLIGHTSNNASLVTINSGGTFIMQGSASVSGNTTNSGIDGGGVHNAANGTFTMRDNSSVFDNKVTGTNGSTGGGVYNAGNFTMQDSASVRGNELFISSGLGYGGGVYNAATFTMWDNSSVFDNEITGTVGNGAGVYNAANGTFTMQGEAAVCKNTSKGAGGGVYNTGIGAFTMQGKAAVWGNTSGGSGGGVAVDGNNGTFNMSGYASIHDNTALGGTGGVVAGGGVAVGGITGVIFTMQGNASIYRNEVQGTGTTVSGGGVAVISSNAKFHLSSGTVYGSDDPLLTNIAPNGSALYVISGGSATYGSGSGISFDSVSGSYDIDRTISGAGIH